MIILDFKIDEKELAYSLQDPIEDEDLTYFVTTMFIMPLRMRVNNLELFEISKTNCWAPGPIMDLATFGLQDLKNLKKKKKIQHDIIEGPGDFTFTMVGDEDVYIEFYGGYVKPCYTTTVNYDALLEAFEKYAEKVRSFLKERVPQIYDHEYWGPWLRGETNSDGSKIKLKNPIDISESIEDLTPEWYGPDNPVEIFRSVKETLQNSFKEIKEIKAVKAFLFRQKPKE